MLHYRSWAEEFMTRMMATLLFVAILAASTIEVSRAGGTAADYEMANRYQRSAEQGNAAAQFYLGALHSTGVGRPQSDVEAFRWFLRAAEQGHSEAQLILSALYTIGRGTARSDTNAYRWASIVAAGAKIEETRAGAQQLLDVLVRRMPEDDIVEAKKTIDLQQTPTDQTRPAELGKNLSEDRRMTPSPADIDRRLQSLDEIISRNPRDAEAYYRRGQIYSQKGEWALANEDFVQAGTLNPNDAEALNNSCFTGAMIGNLNPALLECNEALRLRPNYADALDSRGLINLKLGQYDRALADYDAALRAKPKLASALYGRGKAKLMKGNFKGGTADIEAAEIIDPNIPEEFARYGLP
jgi:tetratricopeptide (TPR) repeat protein